MMREGDRLIEGWSKLQATAERMPSLWDVRAKLQLHRAARNLVLGTLSLQAEFAVTERQIARDVAETYKKGTATYMENYVRDRAVRLPTYPLEPILAWARHIEEGLLSRPRLLRLSCPRWEEGSLGPWQRSYSPPDGSNANLISCSTRTRSGTAPRAVGRIARASGITGKIRLESRRCVDFRTRNYTWPLTSQSIRPYLTEPCK